MEMILCEGDVRGDPGDVQEGDGIPTVAVAVATSAYDVVVFEGAFRSPQGRRVVDDRVQFLEGERQRNPRRR
jgi:hypothetical protein